MRDLARLPAEVFKTLALAEARLYRWLRIPRHPNFRRDLKLDAWWKRRDFRFSLLTLVQCMTP